MDRQQAEAARDDALEQVADAADAEWLELACAVILQVARAKRTFISDDVWDAGLPSTREDRALGPVFRKLAMERRIYKTGAMRPSNRSHRSPKPVWAPVEDKDTHAVG